MRIITAISLTLASLGSCQPAAVTNACPQHTQTALRAGWSRSELAKVSRTAFRESRCKPTAFNGRGRDRSYGLLQINTKGANWSELQRRCHLTSKAQLFDPYTNLACAHTLRMAYGWKPWAGGA